MKYLFSAALFLLLGTQLVFAQTETFNIRIFGFSDSVPPSTPTLLTAVPVAQTQIDISWSTSTDNFIVSGYSVIRDGSAIATTTLLNYSDSGLVASTTYSYEVIAFDASFNYSSTSNSLATTTLAIPVITPPSTSTSTSTSTPNSATQSSQSTIARTVIDYLKITEGVSTTSLLVRTTHPSRLEVRWGRTSSYELGYVVSNVYSIQHSILLSDLEPGTKYEYEIIGYTPYGSELVVHTGSFTTKSNFLPVSPVNVSRFQAIRNGNDVDLSWQLPIKDEGVYVRIVRSNFGFPKNPQDGAIVYQGKKGVVKDIGILNLYSPVYYTAFIYDAFGNVSSGAVAIVYAASGVDLAGEGLLIEESVTTINIERVTLDMKMPQSTEILITQKDRTFSLFDKNIVLDSEYPFSLSIPSSAVAGNLKSIIVTFIDPTDHHKTYSFLLRINRDLTAYEATLASLGVFGRSQVTVDIYDYEAFVVATYKAPVTFTELPGMTEKQVIFPDVIYKNSSWLLLSIIFLIITLFIILFILRKRGEDKG